MEPLEGDLPQDYEQIPWSHLVPVQKDNTKAIAIGSVVLVVGTLLVVMMTRGPGASIPIVASTTGAPPVVEATHPDAVTVATAPTTVAAAVPAAEPRIYSEADLMAALPPAEADKRLLAVARAELFVTDYFTIDGDADLTDGVLGLLPDVVELPSSDGSLISYVEWARAVDIVERVPGAMTVTVWFRTLVGELEGGFSRTPVRAVEVMLVEDDLGRLAIGDVPVVVDVAAAGIAPAWPGNEEPPPAVRTAGEETAASFGTDPQLAGAFREGESWRMVFSVGDASGLRFPIAVRVGT